MRNSWFLDVFYIAIAASYKWVLGMMVISGVVVGSLFAAGVLGGGGDPGPASPRVSPTPTPEVIPTAVPTPTVALSATPVPTPVPTATAAPVATPTPIPTAMPVLVLPEKIQVPVNLEAAKNIGSLEFVLVYEPTVLQVSSVELGPLASTALLESSTKTSGEVWAGMIDANGISGDGAAAVITFTVIGDIDSSTLLALEKVVAHDATSLLDLITQTSPGSYVVKDASLSPPSLGFLP